MGCKLHRLLYRSVGSTAVILALFSGLNACTCESPLACQAFGLADKVFVGKLVKLTTKTIADLDFLSAVFEVGETYKGKTSRTETVEFAAGGCEPLLKLAETYFVYKEPAARIPFVCNRTLNLKEAKDDLAFARGVSKGHPIFTLGGWIQGLSKSELAKTKIRLDNGRRKQFLRVSESGRYETVLRQRADYTITVDLPSSANGWLKVLEEGQTELDGTQIRYSTKFRPNDCDFRVIQISQMSKGQGK
jgi:hypothetical protein